MSVIKHRLVASVCLAAWLFCSAAHVGAESPSGLVRETLRQQSAAERSSCAGVRRTISTGADATLVVRTAVELGYNACQVIRCSLEGSVPDKRTLCEQVILGAAAAGVPSDVISRCASDVCEPSTVATILAATRLEPNYCYFSTLPLVAPAPAPPPEPVFDRSYPRSEASGEFVSPRPQTSPFTF